MAISQKQRSLEEFLKLPERKPALEYEEGRIRQKMSPKGRHSVLQGTVYDCVNQFGLRARIARAYPELRVTFGGQSLVPDVAVYTWDRIPRTADGKVADDFLIPPDIAVEIVSPRQSISALVRRCLWYVEHGVRIALLIDPGDESILLFRRDTSPIVLRGADRIDLDDVLPGFRLTAQELFDSLKD
jgi:Uma2 family endonuclease